MKKYPILFTMIVFSASLFAQNPQTIADSTSITIELKDGSMLIGTVGDEDSLSLRFTTTGGVSMLIPHHLIRFKFPSNKRIAVGSDSVKQKTAFSDPNRTRLFLMPTARPIGAGRGYFSAYELFFPTVAFGIGSSLSVAGGMSLFPGSSSQLLYFSPKVTVLNSRTVSLAIGGLYFGTGDNDENTSLLYAAGTFGNDRASLTLSARIPLEKDQNSLFVIGGELQTSESFKVISENWIFDDYVLYGFGFRFFSGKLAADLGFFRSSAQSDGDGFPFFPWLGFAYNFGDLTPVTPEEHPTESFNEVSLRGRVSYGFFLLENDEEIKQSLLHQGFNANSYSSGLFSSDERSSTGSSMLVQIEYPAAHSIVLGLTYSTIGNLIGNGSTLMASKYDYTPPYYYSSSLTISKTISTFAVHAAYTTVNDKPGPNKPSFTAGGGVGTSAYATSWEYLGYFGTQARSMTERNGNALTGLLFLSFEQRITSNISIGIDASYFFLPDIAIPGMTLYSGTYLDTTVMPNVQRSMTVKIDAISASFNYGRLGVNLGVNL